MNGQPAVGVLPAAITESASERLAHLFDRHYDRLYRLARRLTLSTDDALDLVQETFLRAARAPRSIPHGAKAEEAWLVRVLINRQRDQWRQARVRATHAHHHSPASATTSHEAATVARESVHRALAALSPRRRAVIVLHELEELTVAEIATLLGVTTVTVRWHLAKGRRDLSQVLNPEGRPS